MDPTLLDMIIGDESSSNVSDTIKNILYTKASEKVEGIRPEVNNALLSVEDDTEEWVLINN